VSSDPFALRTAEDYFIKKIEGLERRLKESRARTKELEEGIDFHRQISERQPDNTFYAVHGWDRDLWSLVPKPKQQAEAERDARRELNG
jgi:hypothetical protein